MPGEIKHPHSTGIFFKDLEKIRRGPQQILYTGCFLEFAFFPINSRLYLSRPSVSSVQLQTIILPGLMLRKRCKGTPFLITAWREKGVQLVQMLQTCEALGTAKKREALRKALKALLWPLQGMLQPALGTQAPSTFPITLRRGMCDAGALSGSTELTLLLLWFRTRRSSCKVGQLPPPLPGDSVAALTEGSLCREPPPPKLLPRAAWISPHKGLPEAPNSALNHRITE